MKTFQQYALRIDESFIDEISYYAHQTNHAKQVIPQEYHVRTNIHWLERDKAPCKIKKERKTINIITHRK